ncbi:MAG: glycosyltransferase family 2 protein [bacterium]|nr:glycosyltransferase family 2 protein [bacterium]
MTATLITIWGYATLVFWLVLLGPSLVTMLQKQISRCVNRTAIPDQWPRISVIVPAKDEAATIEVNLNSLLASDYPDLEIIAVNDRSTDETGAMMERVAARAAAENRVQMQVLHIEELPADWLGKSHAMHQAAQQATGELLLFTDGDIIFSPQAITHATRIFLNQQLDHLALLPRLARGGLFERAFVTYFGFLLASGTFFWLIPTRWKHAYVGIGAFNLLKRSVYQATGGLETIRLDVLDDIKLGKLIKQSGYQQDVYLGIDELQVRWQPSAWAVITGIEKNAFASLYYSVRRLFFVTTLYVLFFLVPFVVPLLFPLSETVGFLATLVLLHLTYGLLGWIFSSGLAITPFLLYASLALTFAFWRSAWITLKNGGVRWRDTIYPLDLLKRHIY